MVTLGTWCVNVVGFSYLYFIHLILSHFHFTPYTHFYFFRPNSNFSHHFLSLYFLPFPTYHKHNNSLSVFFVFFMCTSGDFFTPIPLLSSYYPSPGTSIEYSKFLTIKKIFCWSLFFLFYFIYFSPLVLSFPRHQKLCDPIIIYLFLCFIFSLSFVAFW